MSIGYDWGNFREQLTPGTRQPYEAHPDAPHPGPLVTGKIIMPDGQVYGYDPSYLLRLDPGAAEDPRLPEHACTKKGLESLARARRAAVVVPAGWAHTPSGLLLYVTTELAVPAALAAHVLGQRKGGRVLWQAPPKEKSDPVAASAPGQQDAPLAYLMPIEAASTPQWESIGTLRTH